MCKNKFVVLLALCLLITASVSADTRTEKIDFVILMDTSLSMVDAIQEARKYAAGEIIGRLVELGDWAAIIKFYGKAEVVWEGDINTEADISVIVRKLLDLKADGRFTDIGAALDDMDKILQKRGHPERPKYILLLTDEIQEAPKSSKYYSETYTASHPFLEYIKKVDMGTFRVITIGYNLSGKIQSEAESLLKTLSEAPSRSDSPLSNTVTGETSSTTSQSGVASSDGGIGQGADSNYSMDKSQNAFMAMLANYGITINHLLIAGIILIFIIIVILFILLRRKSDKDKKKK